MIGGHKRRMHLSEVSKLLVRQQKTSDDVKAMQPDIEWRKILSMSAP
jgi:hypothetical protein